jgi:Protein of unknown function (DUF3455)
MCAHEREWSAHVKDEMTIAVGIQQWEIDMFKSLGISLFLVTGSLMPTSFSLSAQEMPEALRTPGETVVLKVGAEGAQVYDCKADTAGKLVWIFREPVATLLLDGKTVGRHYVGPHWELADGSIVQGKVSGRASGATQADIPWLKLDVIAQRGIGQLSGVATILRTNTRGGTLEGSCEQAGSYKSIAYYTDYIFLKK